MTSMAENYKIPVVDTKIAPLPRCLNLAGLQGFEP